ncbi:MAG: type II secretion system protein [Gammaproteobacteria bacterium]
MLARGFTLIELLIVVAILGILAAVGVPIFNNVIQGGKAAAANNSLRSIYLMEQDYYSENSSYYCTSSGNQTQQINTNLFSGNKTLDESGDYFYYILALGSCSSGYRAYASAPAQKLLCIDHNNKLNNC